jgi:hypothetical protein
VAQPMLASLMLGTFSQSVHLRRFDPCQSVCIRGLKIGPHPEATPRKTCA